jgi:hypothetical protein
MANYHGINMLDVCGKVYTAVLCQRMQPNGEAIPGKSQMGFRLARTTTDAT